jgi:hypothetical protein
MNWFWRILFAKSEENLVKKHQFFTFGFQCIAKNLERVSK